MAGSRAPLAAALVFASAALLSPAVFPAAFSARALAAAPPPAKEPPAPKRAQVSPVRPPHGYEYDKQVAPLFTKYCASCHGNGKMKGDLDLEKYRGRGEAALIKDVHVFQTVAERMDAREMPPEEHPQPSDAELELILAWVDQTVGRAAAEGKRDPGRVTIRRLNRAEYNNTVRDLLGVDVKPAQDFPSDDVGYGFDNIGDVLSMPPVLIERYLAAAEKIAERAIVAEVEPKFRTQTFQAERLAPTPAGSTIRDGRVVLTSNGTLRAQFDFPAEADYVLRFRATGRAAGREAPRVAVRVDGKEIKTVDVRGGALHTVRATVEPGTKWVELAFTNAVTEPGTPAGRRLARQLAVDWIKIEGPRNAKPRALPESHLRVIPRRPSRESMRGDAREFLSSLARRAYRRPVRPEEVERLARFVDEAVAEGDTFERGMQLGLRAMLVSPHFLYRVELDGGAGGGAETQPIDDHQLASRLSYFLWSSMPDDELFRLAAEGTLRAPEVLEAQVKRMLQDPKARALVDNFATQWLQIRNLATFRPSKRHFPSFDEELRAAMVRETELFFEEVMRQDLPVLTFLDADFTFLNERLAKHYGIPGIEGRAFRKVSVAGSERGGVLTQASVLAVTSNPTRTSPVKRGRWVLEQLLGSPPPPPPPGVPELPDAPEKKAGATVASLRQLLEKHRADPNCAVCHKKMDPLGFGLENFDAVGAWRTHEGESDIDASGVLPNGQAFKGPVELKAVLRTKEVPFRRSLVGKMMTYALGRGTEPFDRPAIDEIAARMQTSGDSFSSMVLGIVKSDPFLKRRAATGSEAQP